MLDDVRAIITAMDHDVYPAGIAAARDSAAIWLGFARALRRSEVAALGRSSLEMHPVDGVHGRLVRPRPTRRRPVRT